jgi:hypothetical protein
MHGDMVFKIKGEHFMHINWFVRTMIKIDQKVCKTIKLLNSYPSTLQKNHEKIIMKKKS